MEKSFSEDTEAVLQFLDERSGGNLRKRSDLGLILETGAATGDAELASGLIFAGTSVWKLFSTMRKQGQGSEGYDTLEKEFAASMNHLRMHLAELGELVPDESKKRIHEVYLGMSQGVMKNLVDLGHDLAALKDVQNEQRYGDKQ